MTTKPKTSSVCSRNISELCENPTNAFNPAIVKLLSTNPNLGKSLYVSMKLLIKEQRRDPIDNQEPLEHYAAEQLVQTATEICYCIEKNTLDIQDIKDMIENLMRMMERLFKLAPSVGVAFAWDIRKFILLLHEMATALQIEEKVCPIEWNALADTIVTRIEKIKCVERNLFSYIPKVSQLVACRLIGAGGFGSVYKAIHKPSGIIICVKLVPENRLPDTRHAAADKLVASIINSPYLIQYLCVFQASGVYVTMMEYVPGVDLNRVMQLQIALPTEVLRLVILQIFLGIEHLHLKGFVHRDIKPQNVLIKSTGHLKVIDFDTTKLCLSHFVKNRTMVAFFKRTAKEFRDKELAGTFHYVAPESFKGFPYGRALDWWALGVTIFRLHTGRLPFRGCTDESVRERVLHTPPDWSGILNPCEEAIDMGKKFLIKVPMKRLGSGSSYREIRTHPFFQSVNISTLHATPNICRVPFINKAMNPEDSTKNCSSPMASKGSIDRVALDLNSITDSKITQMKKILTYVSPGFIKLLDHMKSLKPNEPPDKALSDNRRLYGLGTLSTELNYEWEENSVKNITDAKKLQAIIGGSRLLEIELEADRKTCWSSYKYDIELENASGACGIVRPFVFEVNCDKVLTGGLVVGDIIYSIDNEEITKGAPQAIECLRNKPSVQVKVFTLNAFRMTLQGIDVLSTFAASVAHRTMIVLKEIKKKFVILKAFEIFTFDSVESASSSKSIRMHIVSRVNNAGLVTSSPNECIYVGDVLLSVNGASTSVMSSPDEVYDAIDKTRKNEITITILPISPLRF